MLPVAYSEGPIVVVEHVRGVEYPSPS